MLSLEESLKILKRTNALIEGHFILSSGLHSPKYVQCAKLMSIPNEAVKIIHEKAGFQHEGFLRKDSYRNNIWIDREIVSIFADELNS